jgi:hypothetical protein
MRKAKIPKPNATKDFSTKFANFTAIQKFTNDLMPNITE